MRILVITSCTGEKSVDDEHRLTIVDFSQGAKHVVARHAELKDLLTPAEDLYSGMQHQRLMRGVNAARVTNDIKVDLNIVSAGYGVVSGDRKLAPYEATFIGMKKAEARDWAKKLNIATDARELLEKPFDLGLILLGDDYLAALELDESVQLGGPTLLFCGKGSAEKLPIIPNLHPVTLTTADTKRFASALISLKGELAARVIERLVADPSQIGDIPNLGDKLLDSLEHGSAQKKAASKTSRANPTVDRVIQLPDSWRNKPHRSKLAYFIPEWDDQVDPDYDFETDTHSGGIGDWLNQVYAHQMYPEPNYDGILISKVIAEKSKKKAERINKFGVHRYLRVPRDFPIMGDCGAFGYINEEVPPYSTSEILDYYTRLDFDFGVSIDHFAIGDDAQKRSRYALTVQNAEDFLREYKKLGHLWTPIGAVQGWDPDSYVNAAKKYVAMGYRYIGLGAMVPRTTQDILTITEAVRAAIPSEIKIHLFGVARMLALPRYVQLKVTSVDSATYLRQAWMRTKDSYLLSDGSTYAAMRIPPAGKSFRAKRMSDHSDLSEETISRLEKDALRAVRGYAKHDVSLESCLEALLEYDRYVTEQRIDMAALYRRTLSERPWEKCGCPICKESGIEVLIFRGNNRNRRRGFHNTYAFYKLFASIIEGHVKAPGGVPDLDSQMTLTLATEHVE